MFLDPALMVLVKWVGPRCSRSLQIQMRVAGNGATQTHLGLDEEEGKKGAYEAERRSARNRQWFWMVFNGNLTREKKLAWGRRSDRSKIQA